MSTTTGTTTTCRVRHGQQRHARERQHPPSRNGRGGSPPPTPIGHRDVLLLALCAGLGV